MGKISPKKTKKKPVAKKTKKITKKRVAKKTTKRASTKKITKKTSKKVSPKKMTKRQVNFSKFIGKRPAKPKVIPKASIDACIKKSKLPLHDYQKKVVHHLAKNRGLIVSHQMGSGKTLTAVTFSQCYLKNNPKGTVMIVTPASLLQNFKKEILAFGADDKDPRYKFMTLQTFANQYGSGNSSKRSRCAPNTLLIIDEAHNLRTNVTLDRSGNVKKGGRSLTAIACASNVDRVVLLTGTSVYNEPRDIANLAAMVKGEKPLTETEFKAVMTNATAFKKYFKCVISFYQPPKSKDYPTVKEHYVEIPMSPTYYKKYQTIEKNARWDPKNPYRFLLGIRKAANRLGDAKRSGENQCPKCNWLLKKLGEKKKTVVYSTFLSYGVKMLQSLLDAKKIPYREITGKVSKKKRALSMNDYNSGKVKVLFITKAGGEGLDLKGTRNIILFESLWNRPNEEQVIGRGARYKSHASLPPSQRKVDVYHLIMKKPAGRDTKDGKPSADIIMKNLTEKKQKANAAFVEKLKQVSIEKVKC